MPTFRWLNRFLKGDRSQVENQVKALFEPQQLKVFEKFPADQLNTKIQESFVSRTAPPAVPVDPAVWAKQRDQWIAGLKAQVFAGWPADVPALEIKPAFSAGTMARVCPPGISSASMMCNCGSIWSERMTRNNVPTTSC